MIPRGLRLAHRAADRPDNVPDSRNFRGDIEGLRAIAVGLVLLYHVHFPGITGGFAGVDIFFVISGFLITSGLLKEVRATGSVSISRFYARRARRLLPAASLVLVFTALVGWLILPRSALSDLAVDVVSATFYVVNWALAGRSVDYLAEDAAPSPLQHYWSLSVEEQFYVFWPLLIIVGALIARRSRVRSTWVIGGLLGVLLLASLGYSVLETSAHPETAYFVTTTRVWELGVGAMVAILAGRARALPRAAAEALAAVGVLALAVTAILYSSQTPWPGSAALLPVVGTAIVIAAGASAPDSWTARRLGIAPMRFLGGISYALYLWHWPLLMFLEELRPQAGLAERLLVVVLAVVLSWVTKVVVEDPVRFHRALSDSVPRALTMALTTMTVSALAGAAVWASAPRLSDTPQEAEGALALVPVDAQPKESGAEGELPYPLVDDPANAFTMSAPVFPEPALAPEDLPAAYGDECQADQDTLTPPGADDCVYGDPEGETRVAIVGDSKMVQWLPAVEDVAQAEGWRLEVYNKSACTLSTEGKYDECEEYNQRLVEQLLEDAPDMVMTSSGDTSNTETIAASMTEHLTSLKEAGSQIVLIADNPSSQDGDIPADASVYECMEDNPEDYKICAYPNNAKSGSMVLDQVDEEMSGVEYLDVNDYICPPGSECPAAIGGMTIYRQGSHLTASYVRSLTPMLHQEFVSHGLAFADDIPLEVAPDSES